MSTAQDAFRATIAAGYYPEADPEAGRQGSWYMCIALTWAYQAGVISWYQYDAGRTAISSVLDGRPSCMAAAMLGRDTQGWENHKWAKEHGVDLYMNWDERVQTLEFPAWDED